MSFLCYFLPVQFHYYSALSLPITCRPSPKCFTLVLRGAELSSPSWWESGLLSTAFPIVARRKQMWGINGMSSLVRVGEFHVAQTAQ